MNPKIISLPYKSFDSKRLDMLRFYFDWIFASKISFFIFAIISLSIYFLPVGYQTGEVFIVALLFWGLGGIVLGAFFFLYDGARARRERDYYLSSHIDELGVSIKEIKNIVKKKKRRFGFMSVYLSIWLIGLLTFAVLSVLNGYEGPFNFLCIIATPMFVIIAKLAQPSASRALKTSRLPPILFLRGFGDDGDIWLSSSSFESRITEMIERFGPVVALGRPKDRLRPLGAARDYVSDREWKTKISTWMNSCQFIVLVPNVTNGLLWELEQVIINNHINKLLIVIPPMSHYVNDIFSKLTDARLKQVRQFINERTLVLSFGRNSSLIVNSEFRFGMRQEYHDALEIALYDIFADDQNRCSPTATM